MMYARLRFRWLTELFSSAAASFAVRAPISGASIARGQATEGINEKNAAQSSVLVTQWADKKIHRPDRCEQLKWAHITRLKRS